MKILRVVRTMDATAGGVAQGIRSIHQHMRDLGCITKVICFDTPDCDWSDDLNGDIICLGPVSSKFGYKKGLVRSIKNYALNFDVVIIEGLWTYHGFATWRALQGTNIPYCVYTHGMLDPWFKKTYPFKHFKKTIFWHLFEYRVLRDAELVFFTTEQEKYLAAQSFSRYDVNAAVVGYGASKPPNLSLSELNSIYSKFPHLKGKNLFLFLSRIHPKKGVDILLEAFAEIVPSDPCLHLVIAGPDELSLRGTLDKLSESLGIFDKVTWTGMVSGSFKWSLFHLADVFCLPSHQENFGIVVAEALSVGLPVIISNQVNICNEVLAANAGIVHITNA